MGRDNRKRRLNLPHIPVIGGNGEKPMVPSVVAWAKKAHNTLTLLQVPISRFLVNHSAMEAGDKMPMGDDLLAKLEECVENAVTEAMKSDE